MSDKDVRKVHEKAAEQEVQAHNFAIKGQSEDVGLIAKADERAEQNPNSEKEQKKKHLKDDFIHAVLQGYLEARHRLMAQFSQELEALRKIKEQLEDRMQGNRLAVDKNATVLNDIDDLFIEFKKGGVLNRDEVALILTNKHLEDLSDAEIITILEEKRIETLQTNKNLDDKYGLLQYDHKIFTDRIDVVTNGMEQLEAIAANENISKEQKNMAIQRLEAEIGTSALHNLATQSNNEQAVNMADNAYNNQQINLQNSVIIKPF